MLSIAFILDTLAQDVGYLKVVKSISCGKETLFHFRMKEMGEQNEQ